MNAIRLWLPVVCLLASACGGGGDDSEQQAVREAVVADRVPVATGASGPLLACLAPLDAAPAAAQWYAAKLRGLVGGEPDISFLALHVFNVAEAGAAAVILDRLEVEIEQQGVTTRSFTFGDLLERPAVRASVLPQRALETFLGQELAPGRSFAALVAFPARVDPAALGRGLLRVGDLRIALRAAVLPPAEFAALVARPTREKVMASLAPGPREPADSEAGER